MKKIILVAGFVFMLVLYSFADWQIETVDSEGDVGAFTSIKIDGNNLPHISYVDATNDSLKYAFYDGTEWQIAVVDSECWVGGNHTSLALDDNNRPHISYEKFDGGDLKYAHFNGSSWDISTIDSNGWLATGNSIAIDSENHPNIAYDDFTHGLLKYAHYNGTNWEISTADNSSSNAEYISLSIDSNNNPHISYNNYVDIYGQKNETISSLKYAYRIDTTWQLCTVEQGGSVGQGNSIALDINNTPYITYDDYANGYLKYAYLDGSNWQISIIETVGQYSNSTSIAIDNNNNPHVSYLYRATNDLKYAYYDTTWHISTVDATGLVGYWNSIALDNNNNPFIAYCDVTNYDLKYAHYVSVPGVSLLSFSAQPQSDSAIKLVWQVAASDSTQIVGFNLYRADAAKARKKDWARLNSSPITGKNPYQFADSSVKAGQGYQYRLSALSADGKEEMLGTTQGEAGVTPAQFALTAVYPNPTSSLLTCRLTMPQAGSVSLGLYDISGRLVLSKRMELASGEQDTTLEVGNLAKGIYTVQASSGGESVTKRIVVMR